MNLFFVPHWPEKVGVHIHMFRAEGYYQNYNFLIGTSTHHYIKRVLDYGLIVTLMLLG